MEFKPLEITLADQDFPFTKEMIDKATERVLNRLCERLIIPSHLLADANATTTANSITTQDVTLESLSKLAQEFKRKFPPANNPPDHIVMTDECYESFKSHCEEKSEIHSPPQTQFGSLTHVYGVPIEHFPTEAECVSRAFELWREHGFKTMIVTQ